MNYRPTMLMILDGYGLRSEKHGNAIASAKKPNLDKIFKNWPNTQISASGSDVGLPDGQMGNSEVGHLNIGAGRIVYQDLTRISKAISDGDFFKNPVMENAIASCIEKNSALHLMGLLSDGGVHSHIDHLCALIKMAKQRNISQVYIHAFLDGRDVPPCSAGEYITTLEAKMAEIGLGKIATIAGRYYAMDRDKRWERVEQAYNAMTSGAELYAKSASEALENAYQRGENDEFVKPTSIFSENEKPSLVQDGDSVVFFNFRPDRAREITRCFVDDHFTGFSRKARPKDINFVCMTQYDATMPGVNVAFPPQTLENTLGEYISSLGLKQLRIAETEKYAHVTFFFNGGVEKENPGEDRILIDSPKVATYDLQPEMSAHLVTDQVINQIKSGKYDLIILNYANPDMVGHTGIMPAATKAIEAVDTCVGRVVDTMLDCGGQILLTADHGNAELEEDENGCPVTAHTTNPVPLVCIRKEPVPLLSGGRLCDLAPTLLELMNLPQPVEMTGRSLIERP